MELVVIVESLTDLVMDHGLGAHLGTLYGYRLLFWIGQCKVSHLHL